MGGVGGRLRADDIALVHDEGQLPDTAEKLADGPIANYSS